MTSKPLRTLCLNYLKKVQEAGCELSFDPGRRELRALLEHAEKVRKQERERNRKQRIKKGDPG